MLRPGFVSVTRAMLTHADIDRRILGMIRLCVEKIEADPRLLARVWDNAERITDPRIRHEWRKFQALPWTELKAKLLAETPDGDQLRQNAPFGGLLSNRERLRFFRPDLAPVRG
jgi:hypothetical protein